MEQHILVELLVSEGNTRIEYDPTYVAGMAETYRAGGYIPAIMARPHPTLEGKYQIAYGNTRYHAALEAGIETVNCIVQPMTDDEFRQARRRENFQRKNLDPIETALEIQDGLKNGDSKDTLADDLNMSIATLNDRLLLLRLRPDIQDLVRKGGIPLGHAVCMSKLDKNRQMIVFQWLVSNPKGVVLAEFEVVVAKYYETQMAEAQTDMFGGMDLGGQVLRLETQFQEAVVEAQESMASIPATAVIEALQGENEALKAQIDELRRQLAAQKGQVTRLKNKEAVKTVFGLGGFKVVRDGR